MTKDTSWKKVGKWYDQIVSKEGHYYHQEVIFPKLKEWLKFEVGDALLDLGCGQGVLSHQLPAKTAYFGLDLAPSLIDKAKEYAPKHQFFVRDVTEPLKIKKTDFSHAIFVLSLQNIENPGKALEQASSHLRKGGKLTLVLNHPCFRIPRQTHWDINHDKKLQSRRIDRYMTPMEIPIEMSPGDQKKSSKTFSFHFPLSTICHLLHQAGCVITRVDEWCSNKKSTGKWAKMENRARTEFPLFLAIESTKT